MDNSVTSNCKIALISDNAKISNTRLTKFSAPTVTFPTNLPIPKASSHELIKSSILDTKLSPASTTSFKVSSFS